MQALSYFETFCRKKKQRKFENLNHHKAWDTYLNCVETKSWGSFDETEAKFLLTEFEKKVKVFDECVEYSVTTFDSVSEAIQHILQNKEAATFYNDKTDFVTNLYNDIFKLSSYYTFLVSQFEMLHKV